MQTPETIKSLAEAYTSEVQPLNEAAFDSLTHKANSASKHADAAKHPNNDATWDAHDTAAAAHDRAHWAHREKAIDLVSNANGKRLAHPDFHKTLNHHLKQAAHHWHERSRHENFLGKM
jgi:hypothetical protein